MITNQTVEKIFVGVGTALLIALALWAVGKFPSSFVIPSRAVVAFDADQCPSGWDDFKMAYGRFIRGIDKSGNRTDPDGEREPSSTQEDNLKSHYHDYVDKCANAPAGIHSGQIRPDPGHNIDRQDKTSATGGDETRPKNVALLYCIKR